MKYDLKGHLLKLFCNSFTLKSSGLITTLTFILMDNLRLCFLLQGIIRKGEKMTMAVAVIKEEHFFFCELRYEHYSFDL